MAKAKSRLQCVQNQGKQSNRLQKYGPSSPYPTREGCNVNGGCKLRDDDMIQRGKEQFQMSNRCSVIKY